MSQSFNLTGTQGDLWLNSQEADYFGSQHLQPPTRANSTIADPVTDTAAPPPVSGLTLTGSQLNLFGSQGTILFAAKDFDLNSPARRSSSGLGSELFSSQDTTSQSAQNPGLQLPNVETWGSVSPTSSTSALIPPAVAAATTTDTAAAAPSIENNAKAAGLFQLVRERRISMREAAMQMAKLCPDQVVIPVPTPSQQDLEVLKNCAVELERVQNEMSGFRAAVEQIIHEQLNAFTRPPDEITFKRIEEAQLLCFQKMELSLVSLFNIIKTATIDANGLAIIRQLVLDIQFYQKRLELCRQELIHWASTSRPQPAFALWFADQPLPHVVFKGKPIEECYVLKIICGSLAKIDALSAVTAELCIEGGSSKESKQILNNQAPFDMHQMMAMFNELTVDVSGRMSVMYLRFHAQARVGNQVFDIHSPLSFPFVVITNESQWADAAGKLFALDAFMGAQSVPWPQFANTLHSHFLKATRQKMDGATRPLYWYELKYFQQRFFGGSNEVYTTEGYNFWRWFGQCVQCIRFKRHIGSLWNSGYVFSFMSKEDCQKALAQQGLGTFLIRFSESNPGMLAIAYVCEDESERILNCLIKNEDIGSNKSLPEFLRERDQFQFIMRMLDPAKGILVREEKDSAFELYYAKRKTQVAGSYVVL